MMRHRLRVLQKARPIERLRQKLRVHWSIAVISALVLNLFIVSYFYFNLGTPQKVFATTMSAVANGNWTSPSTWSAGRVPQDGDTLTVPIGITVTVDVVTPSYNHLLIIVNGNLYFNGGKKIIMCEGMVVVGAGGLLSAANSGSKFEVCGTFLWDGNDPGAGPLVFGGFSTPLPVELTYFTATPENKKVNVRWETASQVNCAYFSLERSNDGVTFSPLSKIKGKGNSSQKDTYSFADESAPEGTSYYRLTQVDFDGTAHSYDAVSVNIKFFSAIAVYPNPVPSGSAVTVEIAPEEISGDVNVSIVNIEGKKIFSRLFNKDTDWQKKIYFQTGAFPAKGTYLLIVSGPGNKTVKKIIVT